MRLLAAFLALASLACGGMQNVWELRIGDRINEPAGWPPPLKDHPILAVAFSPGSKRLAVSMSDHQTPTSIGTHVLVIDVSPRATSFRQYNIETCGTPFEWAADGQAILVCGYVLRLSDGASCSTYATTPLPASTRPPLPAILYRALSSRTFWLSSGRILRKDESGVSVLDRYCQPQAATSDELAARQEARKVPSGWPPKQLELYRMVGASDVPPRVLAERWGHKFVDHFDIANPLATVRRRVVWDIGARREIASWKPHNQPYWPGISLNCALSPDGQFVAEGGSGVVRLYRLD